MKGKCKSLLAAVLVLALALVVTMPALNGPTSAVDLDTACTMTVASGGPELAEDLAKANVVLDVYQVASARAVPGIDTYEYELLPEFDSLAIGEEMDTETWVELAQAAAQLALNTEAIQPIISALPAGTTTPGLDAGLYLLIAHGATLDSYVTTLTEEDETEKIATRAESTEYVYTFLPELVTLPTKEPDEDGNVNTANPGEWIYEARLTLKPQQSSRLGSLEIIKGLDGYVASGPATFVFEVEAELNGMNVYSNVFSMDFSEAGTQTLQVDGIPIGATVTVTEVYSGAVYRLASPASQEAVIAADEIASVTFVNTPNDEQRDGGSITNAFTYVDGRWQWQAVPGTP